MTGRVLDRAVQRDALPDVTIPDHVPGNDNLVHFTAFGLLAFLRWKLERARQPIGTRFVWVAGLVLLGYAAFDEYLQQFVGRFTDPSTSSHTRPASWSC